MSNFRHILLMLPLIFIAGAALAAWETPGGSTAQELATAQTTTASGLTTTVSEPYFSITAEDVGKAVSQQLTQQGIEQKSNVSLGAGQPKILYSSDHAMKLVVHALQVDTNSRRWQAQANIIANGRTETVKPISGTYVGLTDVPVLTRQLGRNDRIEAGDLSIKAFPTQQLRKETITDASKLIGLSPRNVISANRPIRLSEVGSPILIKKGDAVQITYTTTYMHIQATGTSLQDGARGDLIRVKNDKSEKAISGRVVGGGHIEVNQSSTL